MPKLNQLSTNCNTYLAAHKHWQNYITFWKLGGKDSAAETLAAEMENIIEELSNSDQNLILNKLMDYPVINGYNQLKINLTGKVGLGVGLFFPIGLPLYLIAAYQRKLLRHDIQTVKKVSNELYEMIKNQMI